MFQPSYKQLNCLGVFTTTPLTPVEFVPPYFELTQVSNIFDGYRDMPLGGIWDHGVYISYLRFKKTYYSVQPSLNPTDSDYRFAGQFTGLLFRSNDDTDHPDLLGQWTGPGPVYNLDEGERVVDLIVKTTKPRRKVMARLALSQVASITVVTNTRKIHLGPKTADNCDEMHMPRCMYVVAEVRWEFNAIFDRLRFMYN